MLLRFTVANHLSIRDRQELSLVSSSLSDRKDGLIECASSPSGTVLPVVLVYGANASGKSNLVDAISAMREMVLFSHTRVGPEGGIPARQHFRLDPASNAKPSTFEIDFVLDGVRHHYGFEATGGAFVGEWLMDYPSGRARMLFEREGSDFRFGRALKGRNRLIADLTRENSLFLSAAAQQDHERLSAVFGYFLGIEGVGGWSISGRFASELLGEYGLDSRVLEFLGRADTGVVDYRQRVTELSDTDKGWSDTDKGWTGKLSQLGVQTPPESMPLIELAHRGPQGDVYLELERESAGTRRLLVVLSQLFDALDAGMPLVVDELDVSLHTQASLALVELFCSPRTNPNGAQLIATVHDTNLLDAAVLRRDQIWFAEKNAEGATVIFPLTDIRTRKGDNLERGYLQDRYGATPRHLTAGAFAPASEE